MVSTHHNVNVSDARAELSIVSTSKPPAGIDEARFASLPAEKQRQLRALTASIAYITKLQNKAGGSIDGAELPCVEEIRKRQ
eukprot:762780-Hanusia_phi.AAC.3